MSTSCSRRPDLSRWNPEGRQHRVAALSFARTPCRSQACGDHGLAAKPDVPVVWVWESAKMNYLLVFIGGGLGSSLRHTVNMVSARYLGTAFPYHTFIINITGSIVMGLIAGYLAFRGEASQPWRLFLMTGVLGGYTTFS